MKKIKSILVVILFCSHFIFTTNAFSDILKIGDENAKITVKVFSSLTCPHCATFHKKIFENLKENYIDKNLVKFEHHAFPLDLAALNAEKIVRCASNPEIFIFAPNLTNSAICINLFSKILSSITDEPLATVINAIA